MDVFLDFVCKYWRDFIIFITFVALLQQLKDNTKAIKISTESNNLTKETIKRDIQIKELELMNKKNFIIHTQVMLEKYIKEIDEIIKLLEKINNQPNNDELIDNISKYYRDKKWLLIKHDNKPIWIDEIEISATQYYYNLISCMNSFEKWKLEFNKNFSESSIERAKESNYYIKILLDYIKNMIPEVILNCPASIKDSDFFR